MHFRKCCGKYFLVFSCVVENTIENTFSTYYSHFLTLSQLPNKYIISFLNLETQIKPRKKKFIIQSWLGSTRGEIVRSRSMLRSRSARRRNRDRGRRSGSRTIGFGVRRGRGRRSESGSFGFSGFFLSLSLSSRGHISLSLSSLFVFRKYFEVKMKA